MGKLTIFHNLDLYDPEPRGDVSLVVCEGRVLTVLQPGEATPSGVLIHDVDLGGAQVVPGFVDNHVHVAGGGGSAGFASRSRPIRASDLVGGSTTTVVGMLGFDSTTRSVRGLLGDVKALRQCGVGAFALVGSTRRHPVPTLTGSIADDIVFVDEVIGAGEISVSELGYEYDSYASGLQYVATVAAESILASRLAGVAGYVCLQIPPHVGGTMSGLFDVTERSGIPLRHFLPSHVNQSDEYLHQATRWARAGGWVDVGTGYRPDRGFRRAIDSAVAVRALLDDGVDRGRILLSSDGNGVVPDSDGRPVYMPTTTLHEIWRDLVLTHDVAFEHAVQMVTASPAEFIGAKRKGRLGEGADADFVVLDDDLRVVDTFVGGVPLREAASQDTGLPTAQPDIRESR